MTTKSLAVSGLSGAGKKTLVGSLIYKCGLQLPQLQFLESRGASKLADIVSLCQKEGLAQTFYAPSACFTVEETSTPDSAIWVVDATDPDHGKASSDALLSHLTTGSLRPKEKLLIVINKMDLVTAAEQALRQVVDTFKGVNFGTTKPYIIAISALVGDNVLEKPAVPPLNDLSSQDDGLEIVSTKTLVQLL